jgi:hypothetical protein
MKPRAIIGLCAVVAATALSATELPEKWKHWSHFREIELPAIQDDDASDLVRVALPEELFKEARTNLADLRVVDANGRHVGYVVFDRGRGPEAEWRPTELLDVGFVAGEYTQVVADTGEGDVLHNRVEVTLPTADEEFFTWVEVAASQDLDTWRVVRDKAPLYRFRQKGFGRTVSVHYPRTRDRWLRLRLLDGDQAIAVERLRVAERVEDESELVDIRRSLVRSLESAEGESWWEPAGRLPAVPIAAARVETTSEAFHRPVKVSVSEDGKIWRQVGEGQIYRYPADESGSGEPPAEDEPTMTRQSLQVDVRNTAAPFWRVTVLDRDDPPIADLSVVLLQNRRYVVFRAAAGGAYRLAYGNRLARAPEYEIADLTSRDALATARLAELGDEQANDAWTSSEPFTERHPALMWAMLILAIAVLGGLALRSLRS